MKKKGIILTIGLFVAIGILLGIGNHMKGPLLASNVKVQSAQSKMDTKSIENDEDISDENECIMTALSPDGEYEIFTTSDQPKILKLCHIKTEQIDTLKVEDDLGLATCVMSIEWVNKEVFAVKSHVNPSTSCLAVYNVKSRKKMTEKYGSIFEWEKDKYGSMIYVVPSSHFSDYIGKEEVKDFKDNVLYKTKKNEVVENIAVGADGKRTALVLATKAVGKELVSERKLVILEKGAEERYKIIKKKKLDKEKVEDIEWLSAEQIAVKTGKDVVSVNI